MSARSAPGWPVPVVLHPVHGPGLDEELAGLDGIELIRPGDPDGVAAALEDASVLVTFEWEDRFLTDRLRWVQSISAGMDQFPLGLLVDAGVVCTSARGAHAPTVADHALALLLALTRGVGAAMRDVPRRGWRPRPAYEVAGLTLGVLGLGAIGEEVARRALALGMEVIGTKRDPSTYRGMAGEVLGPGSTREVCRRADVLVIALPDSPETRHLVGEAELEALGSGWLINVGRGSVVDEEALIAALSGGRLLGAGLDVFEREPLPESSPLWDLPQVVLTPHMAWSSDRLSPRLAELFAGNLIAFRGEGDWLTRVV